MTDISNRLLLWAAGPDDGGDHVPARIPDHLDAHTSAQLVACALKEGVAGLLYRRLKKTATLGMLSPDALNRLASAYYLTLKTNLRHLTSLQDILATGVPVVLIQGAALLVHLYDDPGLRPLTDIDLWVPFEEKAHLAAALSRLGFQAIPSALGLMRKGDLLIDVHADLLGAERIRARRFLLNRSQAEILGACRRVGWQGRPVLCLDERDQAIFLTLHAVKHYFERLIWLADLARLTAVWDDTGWEAARRRAQRLGQARLIDLLAYALKEVMGCSLPQSMRPAPNLSALEKHLLRRRRSGPLPRWSPLALLSAGGAIRRVEFALENVFPRPQVLSGMYCPDSSLGKRRLYGLRIRQLLGMIRS